MRVDAPGVENATASTKLKVPRGYMEALIDGSRPGALGSCAFVGGAAGLKGAGLGEEIDGHDSV